jgi:hypothetical protein
MSRTQSARELRAAKRNQDRLDLEEPTMSDPRDTEIAALKADLLKVQKDLQDLVTRTAAAGTASAGTSTTTTVESFNTNPFTSDFNPSTSTGLKLFNAGTAARKSKLTIDLKNARAVIDAMRVDSAQFGWGVLIANIKIGNATKSILDDFHDLNIDKVRTSMNPIFFHRTSTVLPPKQNKPPAFTIHPDTNQADKKVFYNRVRANMIGMRIYNSIDDESQKSLLSKSNLWEWTNDEGETFYDGVTMLQIIMEKVKPSTRVGVEDLKDLLSECRLANYNHDVGKMLDQMETTYNEILRSNSTHQDYLRDVFRALLSGKNDIFTQYIQREKDDWETGKSVDVDDLMKEAIAKYNNMVKQKQWNKNNSSNSKIVALATQVKALESQLKSNYNSNKSNEKNNNRSNGNNKYLEIAEWRKKKSFGTSVEKDGRQWHWCSRHNNGNGLYVTHKEEDHDTFYANKNRKRNDKKNENNNTSNKGKMSLSDGLKAAMVSKFKCSEEEATKLWKDVSQKTDFQ